MRSWELPRSIHLESNEWTAEQGLLTASHKLCRYKLEKKYQNEIARMFSEVESRSSVINSNVSKAMGDILGVEIKKEVCYLKCS